MPLPDPASGLDFQTLFQIVATFEGFSMWKGRRAFRLDSFSDIGGAKPKFDDAEWDSSCEHLKKSRHKFFDSFLMLCKLAWHWMCRIGHAILGPLLFIARWAHKILVLLLRSTPVVTIPLFSLAYLYQWGFSPEGKFDKAIWVAVFIVAKALCYFVCGGLALFLASRVSIDVPASDEPGIEPAPQKPPAQPQAPAPPAPQKPPAQPQAPAPPAPQKPPAQPQAPTRPTRASTPHPAGHYITIGSTSAPPHPGRQQPPYRTWK